MNEQYYPRNVQRAKELEFSNLEKGNMTGWNMVLNLLKLANSEDI